MSHRVKSKLRGIAELIDTYQEDQENDLDEESFGDVAVSSGLLRVLEELMLQTAVFEDSNLSKEELQQDASLFQRYVEHRGASVDDLPRLERDFLQRRITGEWN
jgi:hypothetical protein